MGHKYTQRTWGSNPKTVNDLKLEGSQALATSTSVDLQLTTTPTKVHYVEVAAAAGAVGDKVLITDSAATAGVTIADIRLHLDEGPPVWKPDTPVEVKNGLFIGITTASSTAVVVNVVWG